VGCGGGRRTKFGPDKSRAMVYSSFSVDDVGIFRNLLSPPAEKKKPIYCGRVNHFTTDLLNDSQQVR